jgi:hypothetical protein
MNGATNGTAGDVANGTPKDNVKPADAPVVDDLPAYVDNTAWARDHKAPIGSPENPIVQYDRAPEIKTPHELEL